MIGLLLLLCVPCFGSFTVLPGLCYCLCVNVHVYVNNLLTISESNLNTWRENGTTSAHVTSITNMNRHVFAVAVTPTHILLEPP